MTLRRNNAGQLGFHVQYEGLIADVEPSGYAWQAGLRQGCRLVEVCKRFMVIFSRLQLEFLKLGCGFISVSDVTKNRFFFCHTISSIDANVTIAPYHK